MRELIHSKLTNPKLARRISLTTLALVFVTTVLAVLVSLKIEFSYDFERFFPIGDADFEFYKKYQEDFNITDDEVLLGIELESTFGHEENLQRLFDLNTRLSAIENVDRCNSLFNAKFPVITALAVFRQDFIQKESASLDADEIARLSNHPMLKNRLVNTSGSKLNFVFTTPYELDKTQSDQLYQDIKKAVEEVGFSNYHIAGRLVGQAIITDQLLKETALFTLISFLIVLIILTIIYRSFWWVFVPVIIIVISSIWLLAIMVLSGKSIDIMGTIIPTIIFVIGTSDLVHLHTKYIEELHRGHEKIKALWNSIREVGTATLITSATTIIGFSSLLFSNILPIREFGLYVSIGVLCALSVTYLVFPSAAILLPIPIDRKRKRTQLAWYKTLSRSFVWTMKKSKAIVLGFMLLFALGLIAIPNLKWNNFLTDELPKRHPLKESFHFFEEDFGGVRRFEAVLSTSTDKDFGDLEIIKQLAKAEQLIFETYGLSSSFSLADLYKTTNLAMNAGLDKSYTVPDDEYDLRRARRYVNKISGTPIMTKLLSPSKKQTRFIGNVEDLGGYAISKKNKLLEEQIAAECPDLKIRFTGMAHLIDVNNMHLSTDLIYGLTFAFIAISILLFIIFRSIKLVLAALVVNIFPLIMLAGLMYLGQIDLKVSTSLIFAISFGIAVDDTVHFISRLRQEERKGKSRFWAMRRAYLSTGKALIITTVILLSGFVALVFSGFTSTAYFGMLVSAALLFALIADMSILNVLLTKRKK